MNIKSIQADICLSENLKFMVLSLTDTSPVIFFFFKKDIWPDQFMQPGLHMRLHNAAPCQTVWAPTPYFLMFTYVAKSLQMETSMAAKSSRPAHSSPVVFQSQEEEVIF